jgi:ADP-heptose:LPS heptosyltransferase
MKEFKALRPAAGRTIIGLKSVKSAMFVRLGKLGDMMTASWILKAVRGQYPGLKIGLLTLPKSAGLFKHNNDIDVLKLWRPVTAPFLAVTERLRGWDLVVDLNDEPSRRSILAVKLISPEKSIAFDNDKSRGIFTFTVKTLVKDKSHVLERLSVMAAGLGINAKKTLLRPAVYLKPGLLDKTIRAQEKITGKGAKIVTLNISAGHKLRFWSVEKWVAMGRALQKQDEKVFIRVLGSPADHEAAEKTAASIGGRLLPCAKKSLDDFLAAIAASDMLVSPDTSAVHAACAFGVPVLGLYPEPLWNFVSWRPSNANCRAVRAKGDTVDSIPQDEVIKEALKMEKKLNKIKRP